MNYIYDILLDFNDVLYDFFDWNKEDKINHIRKIPIFKLEPNIFYDIKNYKVEVDNNFLINIKDKTEVFENRKIKNINYSCLFSNGLEVIAVIFDKKGLVNKYSSLLLDECDEVIEVCEKMDDTKINIKKTVINSKYHYLTRKDISIIKYVKREIDKLKKEKNIEKIKYLYYELFNEKSSDLKMMISKIQNNINNYQDKKYLRVYNFFKLITILKK